MPEPLRLGEYWRLLTHRGPDPAISASPEADANGETNVPGLFVLGDVAGTPLIKSGINAGYDLVEHLLPRLRATPVEGEALDLLVVGAGASGIGAAVRADEAGLKYLVIDQQNPFQIIRNMTKGKVLFDEPAGVAVKGGVPFIESTREEALATFDRWLSERSLKIRSRERVVNVERRGDLFRVETSNGVHAARIVVLALGKAGNPRKIGCPGEDRDRVDHALTDPDAHVGKDVVVYGGGDVAVEAALALQTKAKSVTLVTIDPEFLFPRKRNKDAILSARDAGKVAVRFASKIAEVRDRVVIVEGSTGRIEIPNDHLFVMIGADPPVKFFKKIGVRMIGDWHPRRYASLAGFSALVYAIYSYAHWPMWPWSIVAASPAGAFWSQPFGYGPGFWKSLLYTLLVLGFGLSAMKRWGRLGMKNGRRDTYQIARYASIMFFQAVFSFAIPELLTGDWHWYQIIYGWPLGPYALIEPGPVDSAGNAIGAFGRIGPYALTWWSLYAVAFVLVISPLLGIFTGKGWCSWVCGCGCLAETFGDRWRHLAPKGKKSQGWEIVPWAFFLWSAVATSAYFYFRSTGVGHWGASSWVGRYAGIADLWFAGILAVVAYPFWGNRIWCRYWCPLMKWMEFWSAMYNRVKISARDNCITCGQCSKYCQMGIDVMSYAKNRASFGNRETTCIQCGVCVTVCPMETLQLGEWKRPPAA